MSSGPYRRLGRGWYFKRFRTSKGTGGLGLTWTNHYTITIYAGRHLIDIYRPGNERKQHHD